MAADPQIADSLSPTRKPRSSMPGDVPDDLRERYFLDSRGGAGLGFYADATVTRPAFRDHGTRLVAERSDPRTIRDLTAIAEHRDGTIVVARGSNKFRREAWLGGGRAIGLEVRGYRPTERDVQALERSLARRARQDPLPEAPGRPTRSDPSQSTWRIVETVVRSRIEAPRDQERILHAARARIATWLERGPRKTAPRDTSIIVTAEAPRERRR